MKNLTLIAAASVLAASAPAYAQSEPGGLSVGVTGGTLGIGPEVGFRISPTFGIRANATFLGISEDVDSDGIEYNGDLDLQSYGAMLDVHPFGGGFRISGGARIAKNRIGLKATPTEDVEVGNRVFTPAQIGTLTGRIKPKDFAPTLTLGWGGGLMSGIKFGVDAGVMFQGRPKVTRLSANGTAASRPEFQDALAQERLEIEDDIDDFKLFPILQLSVGYQF